MTEKTIEVLKDSKIEDNILRLPDIVLDRKEYLDVKKALDGIGGKWKGGKIAGFVFEHDPKELVERLTGGEKVNLKKDFQFFPTPRPLAEHLVRMADLNSQDIVLEPSAGQGAIIEAINNTIDGTVYYYELMPQNKTKLEAKGLDCHYKGDDFLKCTDDYDKIIANPPFTKNQDIDHVKHMYKCLVAGGTLVSIMSTSWQKGSQKKQVAFQDWLDEVNAHIEQVDAGAFKESGTMVESCIVKIVK